MRYSDVPFNGAASGMDTPRLAVDNLRVDFVTKRGRVRAVRGASFEVGAARSLGLVGESGSGKSVSALAALGLLPARRSAVTGSVRLDGQELLGMTESDFRSVRGARIGLVFQDPLSSLNPVLSLGRQITEQLEAHDRLRGRAAEDRAVQLLERVGLPDPVRRLRQYPHELSGGMRQRAMVAIALSCDPSVVIADEPTTALDVTIQAQILELLADLRDESGMSLLLITHDLGVAAGSTDELAVMYAGQVVETGPTEEVLKHPAHPYTLGLLRSVPRLDRSREDKLTPIGGSPPDLAVVGPGCPFAPRCPHVIDRCTRENPALTPVTATQQAACWVAQYPEGEVPDE